MPIDSHAPAASEETARPIARGDLRVASWFQRLTPNGSSASIIVRREALRHLGWHLGMTLVLEVMSDDTIRIRRAKLDDLNGSAPREFSAPVLVGGGK